MKQFSVKKILTAAVISALLPAGAEIRFSFEKTFHADSGGIPEQADITGLEESGVKGTPLHGAAGLTERIQFGDGISDRALRIGVAPDTRKKYAYRYFPQTELHTDQGAVMFWVKPENWRGNDKLFHVFFSAESTVKPGCNMIVYKYQNRPDLFFYVSGKYAFTSIKDWTPGKWHHVAAVWKEDALYLYVDGRLKNGIRTAKRTRGKFQNFTFGSKIHWKGETGTTLLDEVRIMPQFQNEQAVIREYSRSAALAGNRKSKFEIRVSPATPKTDGRIEQGEYGFTGTGFFNIMNGKYAVQQSRWGIAFDKNNLYFAASTPVGAAIAAKHHVHDANIWEDDSIEIHLATSPRNRYQFIFNSADGVFDMKNGDAKWNSHGVKTSSRIKKGIWTFETAIPLDNFEKIGREFFINICRSFSTPKELTAAAPVNFAFNDSPNFIKIIPCDNAPAIDLLSLGNLNEKQLAFQIRIHNRGEQEESCRIALKTDNRVLPFQDEKSIRIPAGGTQGHDVQSKKLPANSTLTLTVAHPDGTKLYTGRFPYHDLKPAVVRNIYVRIPANTLYATVKNYTPGLSKNLRIRIADRNGTTIRTEQKPVPPDSYSETAFSIAKLPNGLYTVYTDLLDKNGKKLHSNNFPLNVTGTTPWWSAPAAGLEKDVPPPWTTPKSSPDEYQCWGRSYRFKNGSLLDSVNIQGNEFLASPVRLLVNGKNVGFSTRLLPGKNSPAAADYRQSASSAGIRITAELKAEYDGLLRYRLKFAPEKTPVKLSSMALVIPVAAQWAAGFDDCSSIFAKDDLRNCRGKTIYKNTVYKPFFRIGDEQIGLLGGMASMRGWHIRNKDHAIRIDNRHDIVEVRLNFIDTPMELDKERCISFYLQATPVKPKAPIAKSRKAILWTGYWTSIFDYKVPGYFDDQTIHRLEKSLKPGREYHWYFTSAGASPSSPDWNYWGLDWHNDPPGMSAFGVDSDISTRKKHYRNAWTYGCLSSRSFLDFKIRTCTDAILNPKYRVNNCYFDLSWPKICWNKSHGCLWYDDFGDRMPTNDWEGNREFHERAYRTLKKKNPDAAITQHLVSSWNPSDSFCDIIVGGEAYDREIAVKENYYDCFAPDFMRISYTPRTVDKDYWMIPQFLRSFMLFKPARMKTWKPDSPEGRKAILHMLGSLFVHNINCWPLFGAEKYASEARRFLYALSDTDYLFHPYWKETGPVEGIQPECKTLLVSVYEHDGKFLFAVLKNSGRPGSASSRVNGMDGRTGKEGFSRQTVTVRDHQLNLNLAGREFKLFFFDK